MEERILKLLGRKDYTPLDFGQLLQQLGVSPKRQRELEQTLFMLERNGQILRTKRNRYIKADEANLIAGVIRMNRQGKGFLQPEEGEGQELVIPESATGTAMNGDRVLVREDLSPRRRHVQREGERVGAVVRILERRRTQLVGTLQQSKQFLYVIPDDPRIPHDIYVPPPRDVGRPAYPGDKVVVELGEWQSRHTNPEGEIVEVLGSPDEEGVDMLSVLRNYDLPLRFPKAVLSEANAIAKAHPNGEPTPDELEGRVDCRNDLVITIDPDDAKDFDDAICLQRTSRDQWKLWVHIADVSHYVHPGSALDKEAQKRGNSTYLVDRVIPMLPEALSNEVCSLKPNVDRLTKCVEFLLSNHGEVLETKFYPSVIRSKRRFTYKEVLAILQSDDNSDDPIVRMLHQANDMAQKIRRARFRAGSLDLDFPETKIRLDERGQVARIEKVENDISHQLIEEYMLLANEAVATKLLNTRVPAVHRVHESPSAERLEEYREEVLGYQIPCGDLTDRPEVQKLLSRLNDLPMGQALKIGFLKSLMRARYSEKPLGHYGLNKSRYTHFTSPIRRYADFIVHRALFGGERFDMSRLRRIGEHISETERNSADAERDSKDVKLFAFLRKQLKTGQLQEYKALVTDVRNFGFFVDVPDLGMSGLVHLSSIEDDFYVFEADRGQLVGRRSRAIITLGDPVTVQVEKVDTFKKQVDFRLVSMDRSRKNGHGARSHREERSRFAREQPEPRGGRARPVEKARRPEKPQNRKGRGPEFARPSKGGRVKQKKFSRRGRY